MLVNPELVEALTSVIRTGSFTPEVVAEISKLVAVIQKNPSYGSLKSELRVALHEATRQLEARFLIGPTENLTFSGSAAIGDVLAPAAATEALIISGDGNVNAKVIARGSNLRDEFEKLAGKIDTRDIIPGQTFLLRNTDKALPYNTVMMIGDKVDSPVKFSDTLADALVKLEADGKTRVAMAAQRLDILRTAEKAIATGSPVEDAFRFTEEQLIAEYANAIRKFRQNSSGNLKNFTVILTKEEAAFGDRLNRTIEDVLREPIMVAQGVPDNAAALPVHIRVAPPVKDGR
jgi:hypothetical protein